MNAKAVGLASGENSHQYLLLLFGINTEGILLSCRTVKIVDNSKDFIDTQDHWAKDAIDFVSARGLVSGMSATTIAPDGVTTRAQLVEMLYCQAGSPKATKTSPFTDLTESWYVDAVNWAAEKGVVSGTSATTFSPNATITRQDMATILYNYAKNVLDLNVFQTADLTGYPDYSSISGYARTPMSWAVAQGVICGVGNANGVTTLEPKGDATRAQTAAIVMRFCQNVL